MRAQAESRKMMGRLCLNFSEDASIIARSSTSIGGCLAVLLDNLRIFSAGLQCGQTGIESLNQLGGLRMLARHDEVQGAVRQAAARGVECRQGLAAVAQGKLAQQAVRHKEIIPLQQQQLGAGGQRGW